MEHHRDYFLTGVAQLYGKEDHTDLTIICGETKLSVHREIVCSQSDFFKAAYKKPGFREGNTGIVRLPDDDEDCVRAMVEYMYTGAYTLSNLQRLENDNDRKCEHENNDPV